MKYYFKSVTFIKDRLPCFALFECFTQARPGTKSEVARLCMFVTHNESVSPKNI